MAVVRRNAFMEGDELEPEPNDSDLDDEFADANDEEIVIESSLENSLRLCEVAIQKFFNNEIVEARRILEPGSNTSMYNALGISIFELIPAVLTFDRDQMLKAMLALKKTMALCDQHRRNHSIVQTLLNRLDYSTYSDEEAHAELVHGEALLLHSVLSFLEGEDFTTLIRGTLNIRSCLNSYKVSAKILDRHSKWVSNDSFRHFESGVRMGLGTFNLLISLLPPRIISLLQMVGFPSNKSEGIRLLEFGSSMPGLRRHMCQLMLLAYHTIVCHYNGKIGDLTKSRRIIEEQMKLYPRGVWFQIFSGRLEFMSGNYEAAARNYCMAVNSDNIWRQIHHMCFWELMWIHCARSEWRNAGHMLAILINESVWSKTIYLYLHAAVLLQCPDIREDEHDQCIEMIRAAPAHKQRIAGKSLPMEKFILRRCQRFFNQGNKLVVPALEVMCLWNVFETMANNTDACMAVLEITQSVITHIETVREWSGEYTKDNEALLYYIHGCALRHAKEIQFAIRALEETRKRKIQVKEDFFLYPYATVELADCYNQVGEREKAIAMLNDAKKYKNYSLESRLQFRIHNKLQQIAEKEEREALLRRGRRRH